MMVQSVESTGTVLSQQLRQSWSMAILLEDIESGQLEVVLMFRRVQNEDARVRLYYCWSGFYGWSKLGILSLACFNRDAWGHQLCVKTLSVYQIRYMCDANPIEAFVLFALSAMSEKEKLYSELKWIHLEWAPWVFSLE